MTKTLAEIALQLEEPFPVECIELLPKSQIERDGKTLCMGLPYADVRVYEDRLNTLAPGEWSTPPPTAIVAGQKLIVYVTVIVCGVIHSDVGEAFLISEKSTPSENAATESWAQAFKRACSQFGLGRYLYDLEKAWVPYNKQRRQIDLDRAGIAHIVSGMYKKVGLCEDKNEVAQPKRAVDAPAQTALASKDRVYSIYDMAKQLNLFETGENAAQQNVANFLRFMSDIVGSNIGALTEITVEHADIASRHISSKHHEQAPVVQAVTS